MSAVDSGIVKFKAGKVDYNEETRTATPLPTLGQITVERFENDASLLNFKWEPRERTASTYQPSEDDTLILVAGDPKWKFVEQCKSGRVWTLKFSSSGRNVMFWMQSPVADGEPLNKPTEGDLQVAEKLNALLALGEEMDIDESEETDERPAPAATAVENNPSPGLSASLSHLLRSINVPQGSESASPSSNPIVQLALAVPPSDMAQHVRDLDEAALKPLLDQLPEGISKTREELIRVIHTPQYQQSMSLLSQALNRGMGSVVSRELGYEYEGEGVDGYLNGTRKSSKKDDDKKN